MLRDENPQSARQRNLPAFGLANRVDEFPKRKLGAHRRQVGPDKQLAEFLGKGLP